ncbi:RloB family protein [Alteromonas macleodii]|uniref:RloB family protein n=1 Tax=Alteromonas macleodii TaxID=28108 RepID=UPI0022AECA8C|nr:RloB family protein [Alteromonas macleodii]MCZ4238556.1 RloB family protein [Alteromonas macleodii]
MAKKRKPLRESKSLSRNIGSDSPKFEIFIFCEGENSEPTYFSDFAKCSGNQLISLNIVEGVGVPFTVVSEAVNQKNKLDNKAKKSKDPLDKLFTVWAVFDEDEHPKIPESFEKARANGVKIAYSNPCIEIWALLHYKKIGSFIHRHAAQRELEKYHPPYAKSKGKLICAKTLFGDYDRAKNTAIGIAKSNSEVGDEKANPYTNVHELLDSILLYGKNTCKC